MGVCLGKSPEHTGNVSLVLDLVTNFVSPQFYLVHDDDFTSVLRKKVVMLPPDWNTLFKTNDKISPDELINAPLEAVIDSEGDHVMKVKVKFADQTVI